MARMLIPRSAKRLEHLGRDSRVGAHADTDRADLHYVGVRHDRFKADRLLGFLELGYGVGERGGWHGEGQRARLAGPGAALDDHVDVDVRLGEWREDRRHGAGAVREAGQGNPRLVLVMRDAGDELLFHVQFLDFVVADDQRSGPVLEGGEDLERHVVAHCEPDRAGLQDLGADRCELEHFLVGDGLELPRARDDARVGGEDALDVGVNIASVGLDRDREGDGRGVRAAATERREIPFRGDALEAGDHRDSALARIRLRARSRRYGR